MSHPSHIKALTSVRFVAALVVFLHHYICAFGYKQFGGEYFSDVSHSVLGVLLLEMRYGVTLFFVLSGFLLLVRYYDSIFNGHSFRLYWLKRFARIMPLYWFLLSFIFVYYLVNGMSIEPFPVYVTLTQGFFSYLKFQGIGVAWSLTVEECFYLMLPFLILAMRFVWPEDGFKWIKFAAAVAFMVAVCALLFELGEEIHDAKLTSWGGFMVEKSDVRLYTIFGRMSDFAIGMMFGLIYIKSRNLMLNRRWVADAAIAVSTVGILLVCYHIFMNLGKGPSWDNLARSTGMWWNMLNAFFSGVIIYFICSPVSLVGRLFSWKPFVYLGEISFALYLVHFNYISIHLYTFVENLGLGILLSMLLIYLVLTAISALCYEVVERPAQHLILDRAGVIRRSVRRPTLLRLLGMSRRTGEYDEEARRSKKLAKRSGLSESRAKS
jgi:peptidoglycan/LPS O-acetylase OafA/YrhL